MNAHKIFLLGLLVAVSLSASNCDDDTPNDQLQGQIEALEIEMVALDEAGNESTVFAAGTDVSLAIKITNNSGETFQWNTDNSCILFSSEDFYMINRIGANEQGSNGPVGKPIPFPLSCQGLAIDLFIPFPVGERTFLRAVWSENNPAPLPEGSYFSEFNHVLQIDKDHSKQLNLRIDFTIED